MLGRGGLESRCAHLAQLFGVLMQLLQDGEGLLLSAVLQNPLDNSAAIRMCGKNKHLHDNRTGWRSYYKMLKS